MASMLVNHLLLNPKPRLLPRRQRFPSSLPTLLILSSILNQMASLLFVASTLTLRLRHLLPSPRQFLFLLAILVPRQWLAQSQSRPI